LLKYQRHRARRGCRRERNRSLDPNPANPTLENNGADVRYETDFRAVYARVLESWLGANSTTILGGNFLANAPAII
jgi:hypothetical protein